MKYEIGETLGRGAMGEVYRAWDPTLKRYVALKLLHRDDPEAAQRMKREARAQARVAHPNVCQVFEVGTSEGRTHIAMQLVDGRTLDEAAAALSLEEKVHLVVRVADAVQAAHAVGLIHRDLKPNNILVEEAADGELVPYVLDFGIARERAVPGLTVTGQVIGTPGYMSPEQARGEVRSLDRRSDVFSLGVILYELISGALPFEGKTSVEALIRLIREEAPPLRRVAPSAPTDLSTVVMKCLEKEPEARYPSARALADELRRFLAGEPIEARAVTLLERLGRHAARHKAVTALAAALVLLIVFGGLKHNLDLRRERGLAVEARRDAETLLDFMLNELYEGLQALGRLDLLEQVARRSAGYFSATAEGDLDDDDLFRRAQSLKNVGLVLEAQGDGEAALDAFLLHRAWLEALGGAGAASSDWHRELARSYLLSGELRQDQGALSDALADYRQALELIEPRAAAERDPESRRTHSEALANIGWLRHELGEFAAARGRLEAATAVLEPDAAAGDAASQRLLAATYSDLAYVLIADGDLEAADSAYARALRLAESLAEAAPHDTRSQYELVLLHGRLGYLRELQGELAEALASYRRGEAAATRLVSRDPSNAKWTRELSFCTSSSGWILQQQGDLSSALAKYRESLAIDRALAGQDPANASAANDVAYDLVRIGGVHRTMGEASLARLAWEEALEIIGPVAEETGSYFYLDTEATALLHLGRRDEARPIVERLRASGWSAPELYELASAAGI